MKKPLIRWIVGPVSVTGLEILKRNTQIMKKLYNQCNFIICYNQLEQIHIDYLKKLNIELYEQIPSLIRKPQNGFNVHWKLYPPRISLDTHEICIDNDIIIEKCLKEIDHFLLDNDAVLMYQGIHGYYGMYENQISHQGIFYNSGIYGFPPKYDFESKINKIFQNENKEWSDDRFDEQGLITSILSKHHKRYIIPLTSIPIVENNFSMEEIKRNVLHNGFHFVGANTREHHTGWEFYKNQIIKV